VLLRQFPFRWWLGPAPIPHFNPVPLVRLYEVLHHQLLQHLYLEAFQAAIVVESRNTKSDEVEMIMTQSLGETLTTHRFLPPLALVPHLGAYLEAEPLPPTLGSKLQLRLSLHL
jgi:hypothetical protein